MAIRRSGRSADGQPTSPVPHRQDLRHGRHRAAAAGRQLDAAPGNATAETGRRRRGRVEHRVRGRLLRRVARHVDARLGRDRAGPRQMPLRRRPKAYDIPRPRLATTPRARSRSSWAGSRAHRRRQRARQPRRRGRWGRHWTADIDGWSSSPPHALAMSPKRPAVSSMRRRLRPPV